MQKPMKSQVSFKIHTLNTGYLIPRNDKRIALIIPYSSSGENSFFPNQPDGNGIGMRFGTISSDLILDREHHGDLVMAGGFVNNASLDQSGYIEVVEVECPCTFDGRQS